MRWQAHLQVPSHAARGCRPAAALRGSGGARGWLCMAAEKQCTRLVNSIQSKAAQQPQCRTHPTIVCPAAVDALTRLGAPAVGGNLREVVNEDQLQLRLVDQLHDFCVAQTMCQLVRMHVRLCSQPLSGSCCTGQVDEPLRIARTMPASAYVKEQAELRHWHRLTANPACKALVTKSV